MPNVRVGVKQGPPNTEAKGLQNRGVDLNTSGSQGMTGQSLFGGFEVEVGSKIDLGNLL